MADRAAEDITAPKAEEAPPRSPIARAEGGEPTYMVLTNELPGGRWRGIIPDLPGCEAEGDSLDEMFASVRRAKQDWIASARAEGRDLPAPLSSEEAQRGAAMQAHFAVLDGWKYEGSSNPVFAFRALASALLAYPEFPLSDAVKAYFINAANKLELHPRMIAKADAQRVVGKLAEKLGFVRKGVNKIVVAKNAQNAQALSDRISRERFATGKARTAIVNEMAAESGQDARQIWRVAKRGKR